MNLSIKSRIEDLSVNDNSGAEPRRTFPVGTETTEYIESSKGIFGLDKGHARAIGYDQYNTMFFCFTGTEAEVLAKLKTVNKQFFNIRIFIAE